MTRDPHDAPVDRWRLGPGTRWLDRTTLAGGTPYRVVTLTDRGADLIHGLLDPADPAVVRPAGSAAAAVVDRLRAAGLLLAPPPAPVAHLDVTVVIPARSDPEPVRELLGLLPPELPVILVDDGSPTPLGRLADERPGLTVLRHDTSRGPAAARNAGAALVRTEWVAFLDADTVPDPQWLAKLMAHLRDTPVGPEPDRPVVLAAPQIVALAGNGVSGWFEQQVCALDLGADPSDVGPGRPVSYVPSAAMLVHTETFRRVCGFTETMHVGEDVDLVWRLLEFGSVRYHPTVRVGHRPRSGLSAALDRRRSYGTSAADLALRHPGALRHLDVSAWSLGPWLLAVGVNPLLGLLAAGATAAAAPWGMPGVAPAHARRLAATGHLRAGTALGRWLIRPMFPVTLAVGLLRPRLGRRLAVAAAAGLAAQVVSDVKGSQRGPLAAAVGSGAAHLLDDLAYSIGVWQGVLSRRSPEPVLPRVRDLPTLPARWSRRPSGSS